MALIIKQISVDVASENIFHPIIAKQYDSESRYLKVQLTNEGEKIVVLPTSTVLINASRPDDTAKGFNGVVNEDGTITVPITYWMLELDGQVKCDISIIDSEGRKLTSTSFTINVEAAAYGGEEAVDDDTKDILTTLIIECEAAATAGISQAEALETAYANILKGRNLLQKTNQGTKNWLLHSYLDESDCELTAVDIGDGYNAMKLQTKILSTSWTVLTYSLKDTLSKLEPNTHYTLSFDLQTNLNNSFSVNICTVGVGSQLVNENFYCKPTGNGSWEHIVWRFTTNSLSELASNANDIILYFGVKEGIGYRIFKNLKMEKGSTDTAWCQSPEDAIEAFPDFTDMTASAFRATENFVLENREEWITIADFTTTEDLKKIRLEVDADGNPFKCKEIYLKCKLGSRFTDTQGFVVTVNGTDNNMFTSIFSDCTLFEARVKLIAPKAKLFEFSQLSSDENYIGRTGASWGIRTLGSAINEFTVVVLESYTTALIPTGSNIKIWGLKA